MPNDKRLAEAEAARRDGNPLAAYDLAQSAIKAGEDTPRYKYLQVLALAQMGDLARAEQLYGQYELGERKDDEDALALRGRLYKDRARVAPLSAQSEFLKRASAAYLLAYDVRQGYFPAINAATTAWAAGDRELASQVAMQVLGHAELNAPSIFFAHATKAEALLLLGQIQEAAHAISAALNTKDAGFGNRASAYRQIEWLCSHIALSSSERNAILGQLQPPPVITYTGHMFQVNPAEHVLAELIAQAFETLGSTIGYGALACGSDIMIAEEVIRRGGELHVVLPFSTNDFIKASVRPGGESWVTRFHDCLRAASSVTFATRADFVGHDGQFAYGSQLARGLAELRASQMATDAIQLAIWDGQPTHKEVGAAADVAAWKALGRKTQIIGPGAIDRKITYPEGFNSTAKTKRVARAIIFTDYKGFSKLSEAAVPMFNREVMGRVAGVLGRYPTSVCSRNTWGDALHAVISDAAAAADIVLEILENLKDVRVGPLNCRDQEGMRIGMHFGPVYQEVDAITGKDNFYGSEVTLAARIEPVAIPGAIYMTQAFAAILAITAPERFNSRYMGQLPLAKEYGVFPLYTLERRLSASRK